MLPVQAALGIEVEILLGRRRKRLKRKARRPQQRAQGQKKKFAFLVLQRCFNYICNNSSKNEKILRRFTVAHVWEYP